MQLDNVVDYLVVAGGGGAGGGTFSMEMVVEEEQEDIENHLEQPFWILTQLTLL